MFYKINVPPVVWMEKPESFYDVGRSLREAFKPALAAPTDQDMDDLLKLLTETSAHDMASC